MLKNKLYFLLLLLLFFTPALFSQQVVVKSPVRFLALGDSYTIGQGVAVEDRWPNQLVMAMNNKGIYTEELDIIAQTGWRTDRLMDAIEFQNPDSNYTLVSLLIGVNNQYQGVNFDVYPIEFRQLLEKAVALCGGNKEGVFVLSIPDYGYTPFGWSARDFISPEIDRYNRIAREITKEMGIVFFDITPISREAIFKPEYLASDMLHPSGEMYARWVDMIVNSSELVINITNNGGIARTGEILVFPNPATNRINFKLSQNDGVLHIYNSLGSMVYHTGIRSKTVHGIDVSDWNRGIYFFRITQNKDETIQGKFLIEFQ